MMRMGMRMRMRMLAFYIQNCSNLYSQHLMFLFLSTFTTCQRVLQDPGVYEYIEIESLVAKVLEGNA